MSMHPSCLTDDQSCHGAVTHAGERVLGAAVGALLALRRWRFRRLTAGVDPSRPRPVGSRRTFRFSGLVPVAAAEVFPLLCPVLEYLWLDDWRAELVCSASGVAEEGAVFRTFQRGGELWVATRHEPPWRVTYTVFGGAVVMVLDIGLAGSGPGTTELSWTRTYTPVTALGRRVVASLDEESVSAEQAALHERLRSYVAEGRSLGRGDALRRVRG